MTSDSASESFQLTASRRGWPEISLPVQFQEHFNSQPHEEADEKKDTFWKSVETFQLTASRRGWLTDSGYSWQATVFQLTASRRGWPAIILNIITFFLFQLTASRRGWRQIRKLIITWNLFQLTASRRGWLCFLRCRLRLRYFNSQPHEEADER